jgi:hypothetical protein
MGRTVQVMGRTQVYGMGCGVDDALRAQVEALNQVVASLPRKRRRRSSEDRAQRKRVKELTAQFAAASIEDEEEEEGEEAPMEDAEEEVEEEEEEEEEGRRHTRCVSVARWCVCIGLFMRTSAGLCPTRTTQPIHACIIDCMMMHACIVRACVRACVCGPPFALSLCACVCMGWVSRPRSTAAKEERGALMEAAAEVSRLRKRCHPS